MLLIANEVDPLIFRCICFVCDTNMYFSNRTKPCLPTISSRPRRKSKLYSRIWVRQNPKKKKKKKTSQIEIRCNCTMQLTPLTLATYFYYYYFFYYHLFTFFFFFFFNDGDLKLIFTTLSLSHSWELHPVHVISGSLKV